MRMDHSAVATVCAAAVVATTTMDLSGEEMGCGAVVGVTTLTSMAPHREATALKMMQPSQEGVGTVMMKTTMDLLEVATVCVAVAGAMTVTLMALTEWHDAVRKVKMALLTVLLRKAMVLQMTQPSQGSVGAVIMKTMAPLEVATV